MKLQVITSSGLQLTHYESLCFTAIGNGPFRIEIGKGGPLTVALNYKTDKAKENKIEVDYSDDLSESVINIYNADDHGSSLGDYWKAGTLNDKDLYLIWHSSVVAHTPIVRLVNVSIYLAENNDAKEESDD